MYLYSQDYLRQIQTSQLNALTGSSDAIRKTIELTVQEEVSSYLTQKYDLSMEFTDIDIWNFATAYKALRRVYLDATAFSASSTYAINSLTLYQGNVYYCNTPITVAAAWDAAKWTLIGEQYKIFHVLAPQPIWEGQTDYKIGDIVWWKDKVYTCAAENTGYEPGTTDGQRRWGNGTAYAIASGTLPTNTIYWDATDNRSQQLVTYMVNMVVYYLAKRIAPNNIPEKYKFDYDFTVNWLISAAGDNMGVTANIPRLQPKKGYRTRMQSQPRQINNY